MRKMMTASALGALAVAVPAYAEDAGAPGLIVVTGNQMIEAGTTVQPGGTDIVSAEAYRDKVAVSLRDALAFSPGVYAQPRFGQEVRLSIRGSGITCAGLRCCRTGCRSTWPTTMAISRSSIR